MKAPAPLPPAVILKTTASLGAASTIGFPAITRCAAPNSKLASH